MDIDKLNDAVRTCVRECLGAPTPLETLNTQLVRLRDEGWATHDLEHIRGACTAMLASIYGRDIEAGEPAD